MAGMDYAKERDVAYLTPSDDWGFRLLIFDSLSLNTNKDLVFAEMGL